MLNFPVEKPYDYELVQAMWTLERFPSELLPDVAAEAMVEGYDGPAVLALVSFHPPRLDGIDRAMEAAMREMGRPPVPQAKAAWLVARHLAKLVVTGKLDARDWCQEMGDYWWNARNAPEGSDLGKLQGLELSYDEDLADREVTYRDMTEEARAFATRSCPSGPSR